MWMFDKDVLNYFLDNQGQLFDEEVASTPQEAQDFLDDTMSAVVDSLEDVIEYFDQLGVDTDGLYEEEIEQQAEVFKLPDGRYLVVNA
ncbi:MAG: glyoxalase [Lachnospiraceae bacterium]|nr:glyoxalase [Lachnospiraceae bacterium]